MKKILSLSITAFVSILLLSIYILYSTNNIPVVNSVIELNIKKGSSFLSVIELAESKGVLKPAWLFKLIGRYVDKTEGSKIIAGYYEIPPGLTNLEILKALMNGKYLSTIRLTFTEGRSYLDYADIISRKSKVDADTFKYLCKSDSLLKARKIPAKNVEGYLMPDTYEFFSNATPEQLIDKLLDEAEFFWCETRLGQLKILKRSKHEILTLASIIEAEAIVADEKQRISGVYHNRLKRGWLLQADPTVQFAIGEKRKLLYKDLDFDHPYNTYMYSGLPPAPINCPGRSSILAALNPEQHGYMYFVAVGDGSHRHNFSQTLAGHNRYKRIFKANVKASRNRAQ